MTLRPRKRLATAADIWQEAQRSADRRALDMPTTEHALVVLFEAYSRLQELGWQDPTYCPKDGTLFDTLNLGSTGIATCHYQGAWPNGRYWTHEANDLWPGKPLMFREKKEK